MIRSNPDPTPIATFLAPLAALALRQPEIETTVFWGGEDWPTEPAERLESEEVAFYAEGLMLEGFHLLWQIIAAPDSPTTPGHIRLMIWETGPPPPAHGWPILQQASWP